MMFANRGMYVEEMINRTINYYINHYDCLLEKRNVPIKIVKDLDNNMIVGKLLSKSYVDYSGYINGRHLEFESKQTNNKHFSIVLIKDHQYSYLVRAHKLNCLAFVIVYFSLYDCFYLLPIQWIEQYQKKYQSKTIQYEMITKECIKLEIAYPGILDLKEKIQILINKS